jgi:para-aminobenzoate synthetase component I
MPHLTYYSDLVEFSLRMNDLGKQKTPFLFGINYELTKAFICESPIDSDQIFFGIGESNNFLFSEGVNSTVDFSSSPVDHSQYKLKFDVIQNGLKRGDSFLANLTVKTPIDTNLSLEEIFCRSKAPYRIYLPGKFVCFSPERFVEIANGEISSNPMKGTISAAIEDAEQKILSDFKETAEHSTIVDLIRNDLSMVAESVRVKRFRYIDRISTYHGDEILQVSSEIVGKLPDDYLDHLGDIFVKLLPAGSICGAPKKATVELIHQAEQEERGFYTGVFGYFDGNTLDSAVMIRFIEEKNGQKFFRSGGGITAYSRCEDEYAEMLEKIYLPFV